jgi:hypothetical protein
VRVGRVSGDRAAVQRRELEESRLSPGALEKQREWARQDPDLESLRGDPRFEELVGP